jgi:hypothetical protein
MEDIMIYPIFATRIGNVERIRTPPFWQKQHLCSLFSFVESIVGYPTLENGQSGRGCPKTGQITDN